VTAQRTVESLWEGNWRCKVTSGDFTLVVDEPVNVGGGNAGPQPTELLLASIASCFTLALAYSARRRSIALSDLSVRATGIYDGPRFRSITIDSRIGCDPSEVDQLVREAERVCYVTNTIKTNVEIIYQAGARARAVT
jgi:uncharacterized OsmC-like protein